ncbi:MAG: sugar phosphate isomerase/epimerase family protein [Armatimonadota bacterium]|nr:sugar phosphate isomerase/epimerase [bacterium]MDW8321497.1 sugar phosphate isomerase/epimerase family protein [Armatimonadota bacterium]
MFFSICNELFQGWQLRRVMEYCAALGYHAVEIAPFTLAESVEQLTAADRASIRKQAREAGVDIAGLHWLLVKPEGLHLTASDADVRRRTAQYLVELAHFCADIGGKVLVLGSPKQRNVLPESTYEQAWERAVETLRPAVRAAERRGVVWCIEPLSPVETNFLNRAEDAIRFAQALDSPAARIVLDVKAMSSEGKPIPQIIRESAGWFAHFHANDPNLKGPGMGNVDFAPILHTLQAIGYNGYVSVEVFDYSDGAECIAEVSLRNLKQALMNVPA